jgi:hypothetical protein
MNKVYDMEAIEEIKDHWKKVTMQDPIIPSGFHATHLISIGDDLEVLIENQKKLENLESLIEEWSENLPPQRIIISILNYLKNA